MHIRIIGVYKTCFYRIQNMNALAAVKGGMLFRVGPYFRGIHFLNCSQDDVDVAVAHRRQSKTASGDVLGCAAGAGAAGTVTNVILNFRHKKRPPS